MLDQILHKVIIQQQNIWTYNRNLQKCQNTTFGYGLLVNKTYKFTQFNVALANKNIFFPFNMLNWNKVHLNKLLVKLTCEQVELQNVQCGNVSVTILIKCVSYGLVVIFEAWNNMKHWNFCSPSWRLKTSFINNMGI